MNNYNELHNAGVNVAPTAPTTPVNPFIQVLDNEAYNILTKCDPKLAVAVLSIAVKKFSKDSEFIHYLKEDFKNIVEENIDMNNQNPSTQNTQQTQNNQQTRQTQLMQPTQNNPIPQSSAISVNW